MTNVVSFASARATYRRVSEPVPEHLGDPYIPMRGILIGVGIGAVLWIVLWRAALFCGALLALPTP
jgi:hypothetical protein